MASRPRVVAALAALLGSLAVLASAGCTAAEPVPADVVTVRPAPSDTRAVPPAPVTPTPSAEPPAAEPPAAEPPAAPEELLAAIEDQVFALANEAREAAGVAPLERMPELDVVARAWSTTLATEGRDLAHNPDYSRQVPAGWSAAGENVAWMGETRLVSADDVAGPVHQGWMDSPGHRENLLSPEYTHIGVGVAFSAEHGYYLTQNFATY